MKKKILTGLALGAALLVLAGCGGKTGVSNNAPSPSPDQSSQISSATQSANLPQPTGKVDNTVDAIIGGANEEGAEATSDEADAKGLTSDNGQAASDLGASL